MQLSKPIWIQSLTALLLAAAVLLGSTLLAHRVQRSELYRQSRIVRLLVSQDGVGVGAILQERANVQLLLKFAGAVTSAYINFDLIPVHEADTFSALFESLDPEITVDSFAYQGKSLTVDGSAETQQGYERFVENLRSRDYFASVSGDSYLSTDNAVKFRIVLVL